MSEAKFFDPGDSWNGICEVGEPNTADTVAEPIANSHFLTTAAPPVLSGPDSKVAEWK